MSRLGLTLTTDGLHYLVIDDVVPEDADGILQFLVASLPPPE